jgi:hypothetical protein
MEPPSAQEWFLRKHEDGTIFGPLPFAQLARWASSAQVAPHDVISTDQMTWLKAPMLAELDMDWLVEVTTERFYGPTTLGAIQEFVRLGEINGDTSVINSRDGSRRCVREMPLVIPKRRRKGGRMMLAGSSRRRLECRSNRKTGFATSSRRSAKNGELWKKRKNAIACSN